MPDVLRELVSKFALAAPGADTAIIGDGGIYIERDAIIQVMVSLAAASVFVVTFSNGSTTKKTQLNSGGALPVTTLHSFDINVSKGDRIDFEVKTNVAIDILKVREIRI